MVLLKNGPASYELDSDHPQSLDNVFLNAPDAQIFGPAGAVTTFYDDQCFRKGENYLMIVKKGADPLDIDLKQDRGGQPGQQAGDGIYSGDEGDYSWMLFKVVKEGPVQAALDWIKANVPVLGDFVAQWDALLQGIAQSLAKEWQDTPLGKYIDLGIISGTSDNYHTDNVSSVQFGPPMPGQAC
jgi:hypothetical protein